MANLGVPVKLLHESLGHIITVELKTGEMYRGKLMEAEDSLNMALREITVTARDGRVSQLEQVYIRGSMVSAVSGRSDAMRRDRVVAAGHATGRQRSLARCLPAMRVPQRPLTTPGPLHHRPRPARQRAHVQARRPQRHAGARYWRCPWPCHHPARQRAPRRAAAQPGRAPLDRRCMLGAA
ncbi:hypothetical protein VHUM_00978 [Vanrija humicola]|uniref:Small nuclear ribonucleoprotein Sm D3 n=1 Tax=Vanrija humicola TaxID=5417 RepID=A0A7D8YZE2_VANHU|nr:hypothetical protein VHUM_00978 [Vanrija humicola]